MPSITLKLGVLLLVILPHAALSEANRTNRGNSLSLEEAELLNAKLREAMALYYDQSFRLALPILQEIANRIDTIDVLFWLGHAAYMSGEADLAIPKYQKLLALYPDLHFVRLELAMAYLQKRDTMSAKTETQKVLDAKPSEDVRRQAQEVAALIEQADKRVYASIRASIGPQYDTNISISPADTVIFPGIGELRPNRLEGWLINSNLNGDLLFDIGEKDGLFWRNSLNFLHNQYTDSVNTDFNFTQTIPRTSLEYYSNDVRLRLPIGMVDNRFGNKALSRGFFVAPNVEYNLTQRAELILSYRYDDEEFNGEGNDAQNNARHTVSLGPRYTFNWGDTLHVISVFGNYSTHRAEDKVFSYKDLSIGPSYYFLLPTATEVYFNLSYIDRDFDAPIRSFESSGDRAEDRYAASVFVSQTFYKYYFVSLSFDYIRNKSNVGLTDYSKMVGGIALGVNYNLF